MKTQQSTNPWVKEPEQHSKYRERRATGLGRKAEILNKQLQEETWKI